MRNYGIFPNTILKILKNQYLGREQKMRQNAVTNQAGDDCLGKQDQEVWLSITEQTYNQIRRRRCEDQCPGSSQNWVNFSVAQRGPEGYSIPTHIIAWGREKGFLLVM